MDHSTSHHYHADITIPPIHSNHPAPTVSNTNYGFHIPASSFGGNPPTYEQVVSGNYNLSNSSCSAHNNYQPNHHHHANDFQGSTHHLNSGAPLVDVIFVPVYDPEQQRAQLTREEILRRERDKEIQENVFEKIRERKQKSAAISFVIFIFLLLCIGLPIYFATKAND